jgi:hypothetical protein
MATGRPPIGGCDFPVDPELEAPHAPVFWLPADAPAAAHLIAPLPDVGAMSTSLSSRVVELKTDEHGLSWMRLRDGAALVGEGETLHAEAIGILLPLDSDWPVRLAAADRLWRTLHARAADPPVTPQQRERLKRALRTIDGQRDGASYRALAIAFFGARRVADETWKTSSIKAQVVRLAAHGRMLIDHGYRRLLRGKQH